MREQLATARTLGRLARERALRSVVEYLPLPLYSSLSTELERWGRAEAVDLLSLYDLDTAPKFEVRVLAEGDTDLAPAIPPDLPELGRWTPPLRAYSMADVALDVDTGLVFHEGRVIEQSRSARMTSAADLAHLTGAERRVRAGRHIEVRHVVAPLGEANPNYYHLLLDTIPRALHLSSLDPQPALVTSAQPHPFVSSKLKDAGVHAHAVPRGSVIRAEQTWICDQWLYSKWPRRADIDVLRRTFLPSDGAIANTPTERVYISRSGAATRSLVDERVLEEHLARRGFAVVRLEELSLQEQADLFARCAFVVGPHGAGLANIAFMPPGGRVVELATRKYWTPSFRLTSASVGLDYRLVVLPDAGGHGRAADAINCIEELRLLD